MFPVKAKIYGVLYNSALSLLMKHLFIGQRQKVPNFSDFHWSPHGNLASSGQHFVATRVVNLPKRTETSLITESNRSGPNHRIGQGCASFIIIIIIIITITAEFQWLENLWNHENLFETGVVQANKY